MTELYAIRELEFTKVSDVMGYSVYRAHSIHGEYEIYWYGGEQAGRGTWHLVGKTEAFAAETFIAAKAACNAHNREVIGKWLRRVPEVAKKTTKCNPGEHDWAPYPYTGDDTDPHFVCQKCGELGWSCNECDGEGCDECDGGVV
jgi:hypothetical protein